MKQTIQATWIQCQQTSIRALALMLILMGSVTKGWGQGNESFDNLTASAGSYGEGRYTGNNGIEWEYSEVRKVTDATYYISNPSAGFSTTGQGFIEATISGGIGNLVYQTRSYFTAGEAADRAISVYVNGIQVDAYTLESMGDIFTRTIHGIDVAGTFTLRFESTGSRQIVIDNIDWTGCITSDPLLSAIPPSLSEFGYAEGFGPSSPQSFELTGLNLDGSAITITAPANFEVSDSEAGTYATSIILPAYGGIATDIWVRSSSGLAVGDYAGNVAITGGGADPAIVGVDGRVVESFTIPYTNNLRVMDDYEKSGTQGFSFEGAFYESGAGGYVRISNTGSIETPTIDFTPYEALLVEMDLSTYGGLTGQVLGIQVSNDGGANYTTVNAFTVPGSYETFSAVVDLSGVNDVENGRLRFVITSGSNQVRFRDFSVDAYTFATNTFLGSGAWNNASNWSDGEPGNTTDAAVYGNVTISATANVSNLTMNNGFTLTVSSTASLTVHGTLLNHAGRSGMVIKSDDTGTGTLIHNTPGVEVTMERYIPASRGSSWVKYDFPTEWFYIASPVVDQSIVGFLGTYSNFDLYRWDESSDFWLNYEGESFVHTHFGIGIGYLFASPDAETAGFSGELYVGDARWENLSRKGEGYPDPGKSYDYYDAGWHLLGNPYASGIERTGWTTTNLVATPKIWLDGGYVDVDKDGFIPAMTGFIMQVDTGNDDNNALVIPASAREHAGTLPSPPAEKAKHASTQRIRLVTKAIGSSVQQQSIILLQPNADQRFDPRFDSRFLQGHGPELYSLKSNERLSTQAVDSIHCDLTIPFVFRKNSESTEFQIALHESIPGTTPYLYDRMMEVEHSLSFDNPYVFTAHDTNYPLRFELRFTEMGKEPASFPKQEHLSAHIFANQQTLTIEQYDIASQRMLEIFDLNGRMLMHRHLDASPKHQQQLNLKPGIYMVRLSNTQSVQTEKIIITR